MTNISVKTVLIVFLSITIALISALRADYQKERNDTLMYANHFSCVESGGGFRDCDNIIGYSDEYLYFALVKLVAYISSSFFVLKFIISLTFLLPLFVFLKRASPVFYISLILILSDFRFWEQFTNALRQGLALAVFLTAALYIYNWKKSLSLKLLAVGFHVGSLPLIFSTRLKINMLWMALALIVSFLSYANYMYIYDLIGLSDYHKIQYYMRIREVDDLAIPLHYAAILLLSILFYKKSNDIFFIYSFNVSLVLILLTILLSPLGIGYRYVSYIFPFVYVLHAYNIVYVSRILPEYGIIKMSLYVLSFIFAIVYIYIKYDVLVSLIS